MPIEAAVDSQVIFAGCKVVLVIEDGMTTVTVGYNMNLLYLHLIASWSSGLVITATTRPLRSRTLPRAMALTNFRGAVIYIYSK